MRSHQGAKVKACPLGIGVATIFRIIERAFDLFARIAETSFFIKGIKAIRPAFSIGVERPAVIKKNCPAFIEPVDTHRLSDETDRTEILETEALMLSP
jgi:hypothetical protein